MSEVQMKVTVVRMNGSEEKRRTRLVSPSFDTMSNTIKKWVRGSFNIEYVDDEGDYVTVDTPEEWEECLDIWRRSGDELLKLRASNERRRCGEMVRDFGCVRRRHFGFPRLPLGSNHQMIIKGKCTNCSYSSTGVVEGFCCNRCRQGLEGHGPCCRGIVHSEGGADREATSAQEEVVPCCKKNMKHPGVHGKRCVRLEEESPLKIEGKCANCSYSSTGVVSDHCCQRCRNHAGEHGPRCRRVTHSSPRSNEAPQELKSESQCFFQEFRNLRRQKLAKVKSEGRCGNCSYSTSGIVEGYCCLRCLRNPGEHGPRCLRQVPHSVEGDASSAPQSPPAATERVSDEVVATPPCCKRNSANPKSHGRKCVNFEEAPVSIEGKCRSCSYACTGAVKEFCCVQCRRGSGTHGARCRKVTFIEVKEEAEEVAGSDETENEMDIVIGDEVEESAAASMEQSPQQNGSGDDYSAELMLISGMGFPITEEVKSLLSQHGGDLQQVVTTLLRVY